MSKRQEHKPKRGIFAFPKRHPSLFSGLIVLLIVTTLLVGQSLASNVQEESPLPAPLITSPIGSNEEEVVEAPDSNPSDLPVPTATVKDGVQYVTSKVTSGGFEPILVQQGIPVKWTLNASSSSLNGCNSRLIIPEYKLEIELKPGENLIEFTPDRSGTFVFSCWMGMIRSSISVVGQDGTIAPTQEDGSSSLPVADCCGG